MVDWGGGEGRRGSRGHLMLRGMQSASGFNRVVGLSGGGDLFIGLGRGGGGVVGEGRGARTVMWAFEASRGWRVYDLGSIVPVPVTCALLRLMVLLWMDQP